MPEHSAGFAELLASLVVQHIGQPTTLVGSAPTHADRVGPTSAGASAVAAEVGPATPPARAASTAASGAAAGLSSPGPTADTTSPGSVGLPSVVPGQASSQAAQPLPGSTAHPTPPTSETSGEIPAAAPAPRPGQPGGSVPTTGSPLVQQAPVAAVAGPTADGEPGRDASARGRTVPDPVPSAAQPDPSTGPVAWPLLPQHPGGGTSTAPAAVPSPTAQLLPVLLPLQRGPDGIRQVTVHLQPEDLGPVQVTVQVRDGSVHVHLLSESAESRAVLRDALPALRDAVQQCGVSPGTFDVGTHLGGSGQAPLWRPPTPTPPPPPAHDDPQPQPLPAEDFQPRPSRARGLDLVV